MRHAHLLLLGACVGCVRSATVTRTFSLPAARELQRESHFHATAVVRDGTRTPLPENARFETDRIVFPNAPLLVHKLQPGDVIETDGLGRITSVRSASTPPVIVRFAPGTATSPATSDEVRGAPAEPAMMIGLMPNDTIEMRGTVNAGDAVPGGGTVETTGSPVAIVGGAVVLGLAYLPSAYVAAGSSLPADQALYVPVLGPWIDLANRPSCSQPVYPAGVTVPADACAPESAYRAALVTAGALQAAGAILLFAGLPYSVEVVGGPDSKVSHPKDVGPATAPRAAIVPTLGGLAIEGRF
ncbi:MAG: hypothetical protein ABTD50_01995 [Polyangiaceae bacterium]